MSGNRSRTAARDAVADVIRQLGEADLLFLNHLIIDRLKLIAQARSTVMLARFGVGDRVAFTLSGGERKTGIIKKLNKKTASILTDDGHHWNVPPGLLVPVSDVTDVTILKPEPRDGG